MEFDTPQERFWAKVDKSGDCWNWTAGTNTLGYGSFWLEDKTVLAHRYVIVLEGIDIPSGLCVCHHCDNPRCVNPDHLFIGTDADNCADMIRKGRQVHPNGEDHPGAKLTSEDVRYIRSCEGVKQYRVLAKEFGVAPSTIFQAMKGRRNWSYLDS